MTRVAAIEKGNIVLRGGEVESVERWISRGGGNDQVIRINRKPNGGGFEGEIGNPEGKMSHREAKGLDDVMVGLPPIIQLHFRALFILTRQNKQLVRDAGYGEYLIISVG